MALTKYESKRFTAAKQRVIDWAVGVCEERDLRRREGGGLMRFFMRGIAGVICVLLLAGCGGDGGTYDADPHIKRIDLGDGREVVCVTAYRSGVSCDWEGAR